jgi:hypothetical protein
MRKIHIRRKIVNLLKTESLSRTPTATLEKLART